MLSGEKILVTGVSGQIAKPLATYLARDNEVWGIARFLPPQAGLIRPVDGAAPDPRAELEAAGVTTRAVDLAGGDLDELPTDFTYVAHLAVYQGEGDDFDAALRMNAEGTGLLMSHCRRARAVLHMSTCSVYRPRPDDPHHVFTESDPLGDNRSPFSPTYSISKIAAEGVARYCARELELPTTIARMEASYGDNGGWPAYTFDAMLAGYPITLQAPGPNVHSPIHEDDICTQLAALLDAASTPARIVNWGGDEHVPVEDWIAHFRALTGVDGQVDYADHWIANCAADTTRRIALAGPCAVDWKDGFRRMLEARHPEALLAPS